MEVGNESGIVVGKMSSYSKLLNVSVKMFNAFNYKVFAKGGNGNGSGGMVGTMNDGTTIENCLSMHLCSNKVDILEELLELPIGQL